ncbi:hypothetical protein [Aliarcobacter skirrowii]|uniref:Phage tail tape measure protein n=1 Tax=Aliarcobacter skirrowii TaxID=28200 RepID=A0AAW9DA07_9BACT|nr:hypothetical protein [Aliarcobacter skirrowii]MDX4069118.1 hypothetical protein [Aliarcobacter skirrowii]
MAKDVRVRIKIDSDSQELIVMNNEVKKLGKAFNESDSYANTFLNRIEKIAGAYIGFQTLNNTLGNIIRTGIEFNSQLETMKIGIGSLISVNSSNVTSTGKTISALEKYNMSINKATEVIDMLKIANKETSATLEELVIGFQATVAPALSAGLSIKETIEYTKLMTQAAGAMGIPMNQLSQELKSIVAGTIDLNSAIASNLGITNEEIRLAKEKGQLFIFLESKLKDFALAGQDVQNSLVGIKSELEDNYNEFAAQFMKPALDNYTNILSSLNDTLKYLNDNNYTIKTLADEFMKLTLAVGSGVVAYKSMNLTMDLFSKTSTISRLTTARLTASLIVQTAITKTTTLATQTLNIALRSIPFFAVTGAVYALTSAFTNNAEKGKVLQDVYSSTSDELKKLTKNQLEYRKELVEEELIKARLNRANALAKVAKTGSAKDRSDADDAIAEFNILQQKSREIKRALQELSLPKIDKAGELTSLNKQSDATSKSIDNLNKAYLDIAQIGMSEYQKTLLGITTQTQNWIDAGVDINYALDAQSKLIDELNSKVINDSINEDLSYYERLVQLKTDSIEKELELASIAHTKKALDIQNSNKPIEDKERLLELENQIFSKTIDRIDTENNIKNIDENFETYNSMLEAQLRLNEATSNWNNNLTGTSAALADVSTAMAKLGKVTLVNLQEEAKLKSKYEKDREKYKGNATKLQEIDLKYEKDKGELEKNNTNAMLKGYSDLAGAMSTLFKDGSKEQAAFQIAQTSLALIEGTRAVLSAGTGDPYTAPARMVAMAAMVAPLLKNIGVMFGMNKNSESWDEFSKQEANIGAGSLLGDSKTASDSINNSLESLADYAKPQFQVLKDMNKAVQNINANIVGVTRLLISNSDFAMGKDFVGLDTGWRDNSFSKTFQSFDNAIGDALGKDLKKVFDVSGFGLINKGLGAIAGGLFGKKSTTISLHDSGLTFNAMNLEDALDGIIGRQYQVNKRVEKKKSWLGSSSKTYYDSYFKALDDETSRQFTLVLNSLYDTVLTSGEALDVASNETAKNLSSFVVNLGKISLKGKTGAQIQELLGNVFSKLGDDLVKTAFTTGEFKFEEKLKGKNDFIKGAGLKGFFVGAKEIDARYQNYLDEYNSRKNQAYQKWLQTANPLLGFQQIGEGMFETLQRVGIGIEESKYYIKRLGADFESINYLDINNKQGNVGFEALFQSITKFEEATFPLNNNLMLIIDGLELTAEELFEIYTNLDELRDRLIYLGHDYQGLSNDMITGAGSVGALSDGFKDFFDNFLSDEEQLQFKTEQLRESFNALGLALPASKDEFRGLLDSMDLTTASGQELYGRLIILSKTFAQISDETTAAIEELNSVNLDSFINSIDRISGTLNSLKDTALGFINSFDTSSTDLTANLIQYNQKRAEFESAFENGSLKDDADLNKVKSVYQELANLSKNIATADDDLKYSLINQFQSDIEDFDFANDVLKVSIVDGLKPLVDLSNQQTEILATLFNGTATSSDLFDQIASYLDFKSTDTSYDEVALTMLERLSSYMSFDISKILEDIRVQASKNKLLSLNSFAVGSANIEYDQLAQIHKGEVIVPKTFSDGLRAGNITLGDNNNIVKEIKNLININIQGFNEIKKMRKEIEDIREAV